MSNKTKKYLISTAIYILLATFVCWNEPLITPVRALLAITVVVWGIVTEIIIGLGDKN